MPMTNTPSTLPHCPMEQYQSASGTQTARHFFRHRFGAENPGSGEVAVGQCSLGKLALEVLLISDSHLPAYVKEIGPYRWISPA